MKATDVMNGVTLRLPPGIYEKVSVKDIVIGDRYYDIIFTNDLGIANKREWIPDEANVQPKEGETKSEALNRANSKAVVPLTIVLRSVTTADEYNKFEAPGIKEYIAKAKDLIIKRKNNVLFNIVVEQDGAYTRIPRFGGIELHVEGEPSKLKLKEDDEVTPTSNTNKLF